jgi:hypothetical protein
MSSGHYCVIRDLGLVKGGKGLRHHEVVLDLSPKGLWRGLWRGALGVAKSVSRQQDDAAQEGVNEPVLATTQATRVPRG